MALDLFDLFGPDGQDNDGGFKTLMYIAPERDFLALKGTKTTTAEGDEVTIDGSHTFKPGKGFTEVYGTLDSGENKLEAVGERDGRSQKGTIEFFHPGNKKAAAVFARRVKNLACILIVEELDGTKLQLGSKGLGIEIVGSYNSGKVSGGRRGWTFKGEYYTNKQLFYEGTIALKPAEEEEGGA
ncbi:hypothetical protein AHMF7605_10445 [Adhaeribacter arboris]|uniref:Uncharacterized protein n=1 Tax=Adhaeribacter arboris TaxID=2072846 RepID=A0A2T2YEG9_9BACT|nr:hypothetical protein [Adhaeribacter arboris]PSR53906.1 hypothetical protein AHMF7605_10445 [Adhaeribacter arboris]